MGRLVIDVDDSVLRQLSDRAVRAGFPDAVGFVSALVTRELDQLQAPDGGASATAVGSDAELERLLVSRLDGPSIEVTPKFWADIRHEVEQRAVERKVP